MYQTADYFGLETSHNIMLRMLSQIQNIDFLMNMLKNKYKYQSEALETTVLGYEFDNPVGVAAGFDKNAEAVHALESLGFGYIEVGTVTPQPQKGNSKPRMFKLAEDNALINRLGFNNDGMRRINERLRSYDENVPIGVNIGKMNDSNHEESLEDYRRLVSYFGESPSYYVLNVSCPNTPDKYDEQESEKLDEIIGIVTNIVDDTPVLTKISPDETMERLESISKVVNNNQVNGIIATNTTEERPDDLSSDNRLEKGGLSGEPLHTKSNNTVKHLYSLTNVPIIGVGGVSDGRTAYQKITSGASLVQLYTGIVYNGFESAYKINKELDTILKSNGFDSVDEAVGSDVKTSLSD